MKSNNREVGVQVVKEGDTQEARKVSKLSNTKTDKWDLQRQRIGDTEYRRQEES